MNNVVFLHLKKKNVQDWQKCHGPNITLVISPAFHFTYLKIQYRLSWTIACSPLSAIQSSPQCLNKNHAVLTQSTSLSIQSLLLLLSLVALVKAGVIIPQSPGCPPTEDKNFPQHVRVNLNIVNRNTNSRRPTDYHKRSTSPWTLQYVSTPNKTSAFFYVRITHQTTS